jgi:hypothetical protein
MPPPDVLATVLGPIESTPINIPADCVDGFLGAYWRRPEAYLDPTVRAGISAFGRTTGVEERIETLRHDLSTGRWARRHRNLLHQTSIDLGYRIVTARLR